MALCTEVYLSSLSMLYVIKFLITLLFLLFSFLFDKKFIFYLFTNIWCFKFRGLIDYLSGLVIGSTLMEE